MAFCAKIKSKKYLVYASVFILLFVSSLPFVLNHIINTSYVKNKISTIISKKINTDFTASSFSITLFPDLYINVSGFNSSHDDKTNISIKTIQLNLDILKLLSGKINIAHIVIIQPEINWPEINWPNIKANITGETQSEISVDVSSSQPTAQLINGVKKLFNLLPEHQSSIEFELKDGRSPLFENMDGSFYLSKKKDQIIINISIKDIVLKSSIIPSNNEFNNYLDIGSIKIDQLSCSINADSQGSIVGEFKLSNMNITTNNKQLLVDAKNIDSSFNIAKNIFQIDVKPFKLNYPESMLEIAFQDNPDMGKSNLQFTGTLINIDQARQMSFLMFKNNEITDTLFEIVHKGIVPKIIVSFQGQNLNDLFNDNNFLLRGNIKKGLVKIPGTNLMVASVNGSASIKNGILDIKANKGVIQGSKIKKANLAVDLFNYQDFPFKGEFKLDVDLSNIPEVLISLLPDSLLSKELSRMHNVTGRTDARLRLSMETLSDYLNIEVHTDDFAITGLYDRLPGSIDLKNINFTYEPDMVHIKNVTGAILSSTIDNLEMVFDFQDEIFITMLSGSGMLDLDSMMPWLMSFEKINKFLSPVKKTTGKINIASMQLSGPILKSDKWEYDIKGICTDIDVFFRPNQKEIENLSCSYQISDNFLLLDNISLTMNYLSGLESFIDKKYANTLILPFDMTKGNFQKDPKHFLFNSHLKFNTGPDIDIELTGKNFDSWILNSIKFNDTNLTNANLSINHHKDKPLFDFNGYLDTRTLNKLIKPHSYLGKKLISLTQDQPILISIDKNADINIQSRTINLNSIDPVLKKISANQADYGFLFGKTINFTAKKLEIKDLAFTNVKSKISFNNKGSAIKIDQAYLCDLKTNGHIQLKNGMVSMNLPFKSAGQQNIENLLLCLFKKEKFITGNYSLSCNISSESNMEELITNINGPLKFTAKKGRIHELTLISRILSILNVSNFFKGSFPDLMQEGFAYKKITIEAEIKKSIIYLTKAIIDGEDMTLIFKGWIDPLNDKINLTCLLAPFKTIDMLIDKIPILNTVLQGRLVSIPAQATGKLSDPVVVPLHPSAIGKSLINMMTDILKTPVQLLEKLDNADTK